jgi:predicted kinase
MTPVELVICRGLPASGKSTWALQWIAEDRASRARVNRDQLRLMVDGGWIGSREVEDRITTVQVAAILALLKQRISVVVDETNLSGRTLVMLKGLARQGRATWRVQDFTHVGLEECIRRDAARTGHEHVGEQVIRGMHERHMVAAGGDAA